MIARLLLRPDLLGFQIRDRSQVALFTQKGISCRIDGYCSYSNQNA